MNSQRNIMTYNYFLKGLRFLLAPFSLLYALVLSIRNLFFNIGIFKQTSFAVPVIAVGNLSVGGTGKTPQIEYLIRLLQKDYNIAVLSRGYKRKSEGFLLANNSVTVEDIGDEPFQFFKKFKNITVAVDADRTNGINRLLGLDLGINLILLDDAYQHRKVKASSYILLTAFENRYTKDFVLPTGNLREWRSGANRANIIVVTKCPIHFSKNLKQEIISEINPSLNQHVFFSSIQYDTTIHSKNGIKSIEELKYYKVVVVTGIAKPQPLLDFLTESTIEYHHLEFPDHHNFDDGDLLKIQSELDLIEAKDKLILTTEKDYTRLSGSIENLYSLGIRSDIDNKSEFDELIQNKILSIES